MFFFNFSGEVFRVFIITYYNLQHHHNYPNKNCPKTINRFVAEIFENFSFRCKNRKTTIFLFYFYKKVLFRWIYNFNSIGWFLKVYVKWYIKASLKMLVKFSIFFILASSAFQPSYRRYKHIARLFHLYLHGWDLPFRELWVWWLSSYRKRLGKWWGTLVRSEPQKLRP